MDQLITILCTLLILSMVIWIVELIPLPPVPKRLAEAVLALGILLYLLRHLHRGHLF